MSEQAYRRCQKCGESKPLSEFERCREWYRRECVSCRRAFMRAYYHANKDRRPPERARPRPYDSIKRRAQRQAQRAVKTGRIIRPDSCSECGQKCKPQGHHEDYSRPLEVVWLCQSCHQLRHRVEAA